VAARDSGGGGAYRDKESRKPRGELFIVEIGFRYQMGLARLLYVYIYIFGRTFYYYRYFFSAENQ